MVFDSGSPSDLHALSRLESDMVAWLSTVTPDGQPQTFPIWFLWDGVELLIYSDRRAKRNVNVAANPRVSFHLEANAKGDDVVVIEGRARIDADAPGPVENAAYRAKYDAWIREFLDDTDAFAEIYNVVIRIAPERGRAIGA